MCGTWADGAGDSKAVALGDRALALEVLSLEDIAVLFWEGETAALVESDDQDAWAWLGDWLLDERLGGFY